MLQPGLYEQVINNELAAELAAVEESRKEESKIDKAEAPFVLAKYLSSVVEHGFACIGEKSVADDEDGESRKLENQVRLANKIIELIDSEVEKGELEGLEIAPEARQLLALLGEKDPMLAVDKTAKDLPRPETSIAHSSLFTGATQEPQMISELKKEIASADRIDMLVSFIKWSGLRGLMNELKAFTERGGELRIITTSYMGATDLKAIQELGRLSNTKIKVNYDTKITRLHAKSYVFYRNTGFHTAYVGSSNMSHAALTSGLEWNVKVASKEQPEVMRKINATFETYWNADDFEYFEESKSERLERALAEARNVGVGKGESKFYTMDVRPYAFQQEILDALEADRKVRNQYRNLVVAATGTGKTVISAFDYARFCKQNPGKTNRLLFIAHRKEILEQAMATFREVLKDANFGEQFDGQHRPDSIDDLFMSIQTFNSKDFTEKVAPDFYDYIVVDEFHHAAAPSYQALLKYFQPKILLGLTATPERTDEKSIFGYFGNHISAEIRLPEAIDRQLLCPFQYFGISDDSDLSKISWHNGGYDKKELTNLYTMQGHDSRRRADLILRKTLETVTDINEVKGIGFCVSKEHVYFMTDYFNEHGVPSLALTADSPAEDRDNAKRMLEAGDIKFIFVVDLYNEGVDIPEVNTELFLRPTDSVIVFLQQLGRGLRLSEGKDCLTVLDFVGQANKKYNYEDRFKALLPQGKSVEREIRNGFSSLPKGCYIQLEKVAQKYILDNIKASYGTRNALISRIQTFEDDSGQKLSFANFLDYYHLDPRDVYKKCSFSRLCVAAGVRDDFDEPAESRMNKAFVRFASVDSRRFIAFLKRVVPNLDRFNPSMCSAMDLRMMQMFYATIWGTGVEDWNDPAVQGNLASLVDSPVLMEELLDLLDYNYGRIDFVDESVSLGFGCPLDLHCTYSRDQLMVAMDFLKPGTVREGVKWLPNHKIDVLLVTLNKSEKEYSPTTMYEDYSINESLFHWQSQSTTSNTSKTGRRYIGHKESGSYVVLFVRQAKKDRYGNVMPYTYLGKVEYQSHTGSRPMSVIWHLERPMPAKYLRKTATLMVG
jgi:superfamily II DNA or RNA helicase